MRTQISRIAGSVCIAAAAGIAVLPQASFAQWEPSKTVEFVVPAGPGGGLYTSETQTGLSKAGFGTIAAGIPPIDSDRDGMADDLEAAKALNPNSSADGGVTAASGYTNLEDYLNWLALPHAFAAKNTASLPTSLDIDLRNYADGFPAGATYTVSAVAGGASRWETTPPCG